LLVRQTKANAEVARSSQLPVQEAAGNALIQALVSGAWGGEASINILNNRKTYQIQARQLDFVLTLPHGIMAISSDIAWPLLVLDLIIANVMA
jgi:hypothetical protein